MKEETQERKKVEFYFWIHDFFRKYVEVTMDIILIGLVVVAFVFIIKTIYNLGKALYTEPDIAYVVSEIMFIFILIEVVRLLIIYLQFHRVAIDTMVEISIVSVLRELILNGVLHTEPILIASASLLILVLMLLLRLGNIRYTGPELYSEYRPFFGKKIKKLKRFLDSSTGI